MGGEFLKINYIFSCILLVGCLSMIYIGYYSLKKNKAYALLALVPVVIYSFGYSFEILSSTIEKVKFWIKIEYLGIPFLGMFWLIVAINFSGYGKYLKKRILTLLLIIPIITLILCYTNDLHHLYYKDLYMNNNSIFPVVEIVEGPWYLVEKLYEYLLMVSGFIIFTIAYLNSVEVIRKHILIITLAWSIPWLSDVIYLFKVLPFHIDLCPIVLSFSAIIYAFFTLKFNFVSLTPVALEKVFSNMAEGIIILDSENNIVNFNNSAMRIMPDLNTMKLEKVKIDEVLGGFEEILKKINNNDCNDNLIDTRVDGELRYYMMNSTIIYKKNKNIVGKILNFNDITEIKMQQEKLLELNNFKDKLFTVVSHDIKSPLSVLITLVEILNDGDELDAEDNKEILAEISKNINNTYEMVENVLEWFKNQINIGVLKNIECNLLNSAKESIMPLMQNAKLKGVDVFIDIPEDILVYVDKNMFEIVLRNLFSNAIKFTQKGDSIKILAQEFAGTVTIVVSDTGIGIKDERIKEIFNNSHFHTTFGTAGEKGTGMGLRICKEIIEKNNGRIWVKSNVGEGSTFYFTVSTYK